MQNITEAASYANAGGVSAQDRKNDVFQKGFYVLHGIQVVIQNAKGSTRSGTSPDGKTWSNTLNAHYGYIMGSRGADGDSVDVYFGDDAESDNPGIFIVDQIDPKTGEFDEHKVMFGYPDADTAKAAYLGNYDAGWKGFSSIREVTLEELKDWLVNNHESNTTMDAVNREPPDFKVSKIIQDDYDDGIQSIFVWTQAEKRFERYDWGYGDAFETYEKKRDSMPPQEEYEYIRSHAKLMKQQKKDGATLDAVNGLMTAVMDSVSLSGMEKMKLVRELSGIRAKVSDPATKGVEKIKLVKRISEIRVLLGGESQAEKAVTDNQIDITLPLSDHIANLGLDDEVADAAIQEGRAIAKSENKYLSIMDDMINDVASHMEQLKKPKGGEVYGAKGKQYNKRISELELAKLTIESMKKDWANPFTDSMSYNPLPEFIKKRFSQKFSGVETGRKGKRAFYDEMLVQELKAIYRAAEKAEAEAQNIADIEGDVVVNEAEEPSKPLYEELKDARNNNKSQFGLQAGEGDVTREKINAQVRDIVRQIKEGRSTAALTGEELAVMQKYSGKGGLKEGSQYEYYTPVPVAAGMWDMLKEYGFTAGNVLEPSTGAGVFSATKPKGVIITGAEIDETSATVNQVLHPEDKIHNQSFEELVTSNDNVTYDAVIGNIPFGDQRGEYARKDPAFRAEKRIERYFIHRAIDKVKEGGLIVLVVPTGVIANTDKGWSKFRADISKKAEFLGAHKLPSKTFARQGTDTVTDVLVMRKHPMELLEKVDNLPVETLQSSNVLWNEFIAGKYWKGEGKPFIHGKYVEKVAGDRFSREQVIAQDDFDDKALQLKLASRFHSRINWDLLDAMEPEEKSYQNGDAKIINGLQHELKNGVWVRTSLDDGIKLEPKDFGADSVEDLQAKLESMGGMLSLGFESALKVRDTFGTGFVPADLLEVLKYTERQPENIRNHVYRGTILGKSINALQNMERTGTTYDSADIDGLREQVRTALEADYRDNGHHSKQNKGIIRSGHGSRDYGAYEAAIGKDGSLSALITGKLDTESAKGYDEHDISSIVSHFYNIEMEPVTLDDVRSYYKGDKPPTDLSDLVDFDDLAISPEGGIYPIDTYCSGEFMPKLQAMTMAMATEQDNRLLAKYQQQIDRIESRRIKTPTADILFAMRQKWIEPKYVAEFLKQNGFSSISLSKSGTWGHGSFKPRGLELRLLRYLQGDKITGDQDMRATEYREKIHILEDQFNMFMKIHPDSVMLTEQFNATMNGYIPFEYSDQDLGIAGVSDKIKYHNYQNKAIRQLSDQGRGILGDGVGLGKTGQALGLYQYDLEKGRSKRTCIVVPVSVMQNWYNEAHTFLKDNSNTLFVGFTPKRDADGNIQREPLLDEKGEPKVNKYTGETVMQDVLQQDDAKTVKEKLRSIPQSNYSLVVMPMTRFGEIPMRDDTVDGYMASWVTRGMMSNASKGHAEDKKRARLRGEFSDTGAEKDDALPFFEDMMFDKVIVDEGHYFKNSYKAGSEASRISNIPSSATSQRAVDMAMKLAHVRDVNGGRGTFMLTATPFTNSPVEIFNMMAMTMPMEAFEGLGVYSTDDFVRVFGRTEIKSRVTLAGDITDAEMLTGFTNLQGLRAMFYRYAVVRDADDVKQDMRVPPANHSREEVSLSEEQEAIYEELREEAQREVDRLMALEGESDAEQEELPKRHAFSILRDMERVSTDMDLYYRQMTFIFSGLAEVKVKEIVALLPASKTITQDTADGREKLDVDLEYSIHSDGGDTTLVVPESYEGDVEKAVKALKIKPESVTHPVTPKYAKLLANLKAELDAGGKQLVFTEEKTQHRKLARLIAHHLSLKENQIGIINADEAGGEKLQEIADGYNAGKQVIVIANKKAEVGVNLQKGTTAIHHMTFPWTPSSLEQRNGRGVRQGNEADRVNVYYYVAKRSVDTLRLDRIQGKENWIKQMVHGESAELDYKDESTLSNDDYLYLFSKNPEEAKARLKVEEAKAKAKAKEKKDKALLIAFAQYSEAKNFVDNFDAILADESSKARSELASQESQLRGLKHRYGDDNRQVSEIERTIITLKKREAMIEARMRKYLAQSQAAMAQQEAYLKGSKDKLPFDIGLLDSPTSVIVSNTGKIIQAGKTYELPEMKGRYGNTEKRTVFKVDGVDFKSKTVSLLVITGDKNRAAGYGGLANAAGVYSGVSIARLDEAKEVHYSDEEIDLIRLDARNSDMYCRDLLTYDKSFFDRHKDKFAEKIRYGHYFIAAMQSGDYAVVQSGYGTPAELPDGATLAYPDKDNSVLVEQLLKLYLVQSRKGYVSWGDDILKLVAGGDWKEKAKQYYNSGSKTEILDAVDKLWNSETAGIDDPIEQVKKLGHILTIIVSVKDDLVGRIQKDRDWDNKDDIKAIANEFLTGKWVVAKAEKARIDAEAKAKREAEEAKAREELQAKKAAEEAQQEEANKAAWAAEEERNKQKANYKEIPAEIREKLAAIGVTIRYPSEDMAYGSGRRAGKLKAFHHILIGGETRKVWSQLNSSFGVTFTDDIKHHAFAGNWIIIKGGETPEDVAKAILPSEEAIASIVDAKIANADAPKKLIVPADVTAGAVIQGKGWIVTGTGKSWEIKSYKLADLEDQPVQFNIQAGDEVHYAYFN